MKKLIATAVLATSALSYAAERAIYDIMYLPTAGTTFGISEGNYVMNKIDSDNGDSETTGFIIDQTIGHSISDRLALALNLDYTNLEVDEDNSPKTEQTGLSDPSVLARFRLMDEAFRWDILGGVRLSLADAEIEANGDQDNLQGGHALTIGSQFGEKTESFQWAVLALYTRNLERTFDVEGQGDLEADANNEVQVSFELLNKLAEKSFLRSNLSAALIEGTRIENGSFVPEERVYQIGTQYQHLLSQDLLLKGGVDYQMRDTDSGNQDSNNTIVLTVGANYQF